MDISAEQQLLREFAHDRDWEQFHTPKNLVMALGGEAGELAALFQWLTPEQSELIMSTERAQHVRDEIADVTIYLIRLADILGIDLTEAVEAKVAKNSKRYTLAASRGSSAKR